MKLQLSMCVGDYDLNRALLTGEVQPDGIELNVMTDNSPHRHWRMARHGEFDVCEFAMAKMIMLERNESTQYVRAIPAFPHRRFRHSFIYVRRDSPIAEPHELNGCRIGLRSWQNTAGMWIRGMLQDFYAVDLASISWVTQDDEDIRLPDTTGTNLNRAPQGGNVFEMLVQGDLDCVIYPERPPALRASESPIRTLFVDPKRTEIEFYRETGLFPIMHTVVVKEQVLDRAPWVAVSLLDAFRRSKERAFERMLNPRSVSLAWLEEARREQQEVLGPDPWRYNFADNRVQIERMIRWSYEQGLSTARRQAESLFAPSTVDEAPDLVGI